MDNTSNLKNTIDAHMKTLPRAVQEAIHASSWERKILAIGRKHGLHVDQLEILQTELSLAVLGLTRRDEFVRETMREAGISREIMNDLVEDINTEIFFPIREYLKNHTKPFSEEGGDTLDERERATLKKHGVALDGDEDEEDEKTNEPMVASPIQKPVPLFSETQTQTNPNTPVVNPQTPKPPVQTSSIHDISNLDYLGDDEDEKDEEKVTNGVQNQPQTIPGEDIDPQKLKSAETQTNQTKIQQVSGYQGSDPYREPIE